MRPSVMLISVAVAAAATASGQEILREITWADAKPVVGQLVAADPDTEFDQLKIDNSTDESQAFTVLTIDEPQVLTTRYALTGQVRYDNVTGSGYLEMLSRFPDGGEHFSRTLNETGAMQHLHSSSGWRPFVLPFSLQDEQDARPDRLTLNVVLPGRGTVYLGPVRLVQYRGLADPLSAPGAWWGGRTAGLYGGCAGGLVGLIGAVIGILTSLGRGRSFVIVLGGVLFLLGLTALAAGVVALLQSQPYAVYYPLLLLGGLCTLLPAVLLRNILDRYARIELRRMSALDAS